MTPRMSFAELALFQSFLRCSCNYLEFGAGGSTAIATSLVKNSVISIDSSIDWLNDVREYCAERSDLLQPFLFHVDIGPTVEWGYPANGSERASWPNYHSKVWENRDAWNADLYLVDGRFRVACFMQILFHCGSKSTILIHDFVDRPSYHAVHDFADEIVREGSLSGFRPRATFDREAAWACLEAHKFTLE